MGIPLLQSLRVGAYILKQRLRGVRRYPLVLMLEPLFRCNLECAGCGKIQYPEAVLSQRLTPEQCFRAAEECGAPVVSIPGGEPLIHPEIGEIVGGLVARRRVVYLCTNAILLERKLHLFTPSPYLSFSVHVDGLGERHDRLVCREGVFDTAVAAIRAAKTAGFRVTTNSTFFEGEDPEAMRRLFDLLMGLGVDGMTISPGYAYAKAPDQEHFLRRERTRSLFREALRERETRGWVFNHSPFYLDFLEGRIDYRCTPWGNPTYNVFGWQRPCYLVGEGYARSFRELMDETDWEAWGTDRNPKCADCMVHSGYEPTAVLDATSSVRNVVRSAVAAAS
ncbi:MAG: adenosyl-hopene transferase HpnH [Planctomycetes bacterium]|nr:adenosyl-hopene transferase HpnH [Planctomycetota bacterium]